MKNFYIGGVRPFLPGPAEPAAALAGESWSFASKDTEVFLHWGGPHWRCFAEDDLAILIRGYAVSGEGPPDLATVADQVRRHYRRHGELPAKEFEGSFTLLLLDGRAGKVVLFRNLVGNGYTYYTESPGGFLFGSNLADLADFSGRDLSANQDALPALFLFRMVPGRETLLDGFYRLLAGEQVTFDRAGLDCRQTQTFADWAGDPYVSRHVVERTEATLRRVLRDQAALYPEAANLLSGGVDSSYIQAVWNQVRPGSPASFSVSVDHPRTRGDTIYALTAALAFNTRHRLVPADGPFADYLLESVAGSAEPPDHVMSAYFRPLARAMGEHGDPVGLCGEGADSMFGLGEASLVRMALVIRDLLPFRFLRKCGGWLAGLAGREYLCQSFRLADVLAHADDPGHPLNQVGLFTDWAAADGCFGAPSLRNALADRRALLERYQVPWPPLEQLHGMAYLAAAPLDSAALWTTHFNAAGGELLCPFLDSRMVRLAFTLDPRHRFVFQQPKSVLKRALARHVGRDLAYRSKLAFGQPIFEWLAPGGQLRPWVDRIGHYDFLAPDVRATALARPNWFLYSLLCYDLWHKLFIDRSLPRSSQISTPLRSTAHPRQRVDLGVVCP